MNGFLVMVTALAVLPGPGTASGVHEGPDPGTLEGSAVGDTVVRARPGEVLSVRNLTGRLMVRAVEGDELRLIAASPSDAGRVAVVRSDNRLHLEQANRGERSFPRDLVVEVPAWLALDLASTELAVTVEGLRADVSIRNVDGDLEVRGVIGSVTLWSVDGEIRLADVSGRISARSVDEAVELARVSGEVQVGSTDGDVRMVQMDARRVDAQSVDGDITFDGALQPGGSYVLVTHGGDVTTAVPEDAGARVEVSTFDGSFAAGFPVTVERFRGGREMSFTLGDGSARLVLQAFDGDIRIRRRR